MCSADLPPCGSLSSCTYDPGGCHMNSLYTKPQVPALPASFAAGRLLGAWGWTRGRRGHLPHTHNRLRTPLQLTTEAGRLGRATPALPCCPLNLAPLCSVCGSAPPRRCSNLPRTRTGMFLRRRLLLVPGSNVRLTPGSWPGATVPGWCPSSCVLLHCQVISPCRAALSSCAPCPSRPSHVAPQALLWSGPFSS